jgi:hypothetical protein
LDRNEIANRIREFDREAYLLLGEASVSSQVVIMGGSAFILNGFTLRITHDIDVLFVPAKLTALLQKYDMSSSVTSYIDCLPYNYEDRLKPVAIKDTFLQYLTPSLEDLVVMKLYGMRPPDLQDITSREVLKSIDWSLLERLVYDPHEARASALSERRYKEMVCAFEQYKKEHKDAEPYVPGLS